MGYGRGSGLGERNSEKAPPDENIADVRPPNGIEETRKHQEDADRAMKELLEEEEKAEEERAAGARPCRRKFRRM